MTSSACTNFVIFSSFVWIAFFSVHVLATEAEIEDDDFFLSLILPHINETCMSECSQRSDALQAQLSAKYPKKEEEIAQFPVTPGFLTDFCGTHREDESCRSQCGNMSADARFAQIVWSLPQLVCKTEHQSLTSKMQCLMESKQATDPTCLTACASKRQPSIIMRECNRYSCIFDCQKPVFDQRCGSGMVELVKKVRKHAWPSQCDDH